MKPVFISYNLFLLKKKIKTKFYIFFERKSKSEGLSTIEEFQFFLIKNIFNNLIQSEKKLYFNTNVKNKGKPNTLAQARILLSFCKLYNNNQMNFNGSYLIEYLKEFILSLQEESGIYKFNQRSWNLQDEGIATVWVLLALLQVYKITNNEKLFEQISAITAAMNEKLVDKNNSLKHTLGDNFWNLNAASTYAFFISQFLSYSQSEELVRNYENAVELCVNKLSDDGYFPYSEKRRGTYLLLYNPIVIYTLENSLKADFINPELIKKTEAALEKARLFLLKQMDEEKFFVEPEQKKFSRYIVSNLTSLVALKNKISKDTELRILDNILSYLIKDKLYLCRDDNGKYFNGSLYEVKDVLLTEVFYWLITYLYD